MMPPGMDIPESWTAFRFEDCSRILRSAKIFSSTGYDSTIGLVMGHMILGMDDPEHRLNRNLVSMPFANGRSQDGSKTSSDPYATNSSTGSPVVARRNW
jgi:cytochrome P450